MSALTLFEDQKECPESGKNALIVYIYGYICHLKCCFKSV